MTSVHTARLLGNLPLFRHLDDEQLTLFASRVQLLRLDKHRVLFERGQMARALHVVAMGSVKLSIPGLNGHEKVVEIFTAGQSFGEASMFLDSPYLVQATMLEDSLIVEIAKEDIDAALDADPMLARRMLAGLSQRLHTLMRDIEAVSLRKASERLLDFLATLPAQNNVISLPFSKATVASKLNLSPETLSRLFADLSEQGVLTVKGRQLLLHRREALLPAE